MTFTFSINTFSILILTSRVFALQVTPGSQCSSICLDVAKANIADPNASNTFATDIVCRDDGYSQTEAGRKFKTCMNCLQGSSASELEENDQSWFLYNLRFAASSCLFDSMHDTSEETCVSTSTCGSLRQNLEVGSLDPAKNAFSYCTINGASFGSNVDGCVTCLSKSTKKYLANFLTALKAGCVQRPTPRLLLGIEGDIFSNSLVTITVPGDTPSPTTSSTMKPSSAPIPSVSPTSKGLSREAIAGIVAGIGTLVLAAALGFCFFVYKRNKKNSMTQLRSPLDSRFGSTSITSPNSGSFGDPYSNPQVNVKENYSAKEMELLQCTAPPLPLVSPSSRVSYTSLRGDRSIKLDTQSFNSTYAGGAMPTHPAYLSDVASPISPATSITSNRTYGMSRYSGQSDPKKSPNILPPTVESPQTPSQSPKIETVFALKAPPRRIDTTPTSKSSPPVSYPQDHPQQEEQTSREYNQIPLHSFPQSRQQAPSSRIYGPTMHSQGSPELAAPTRPRSRSRTKHPSASRSNSISNAWKRATHLAGIGDSNASIQKPIQVSGPMISHSNRFDFDLAAEERLKIQRDDGPPTSAVAMKGRNLIDTPSSATSDDQLW